MTAPHMVDTIPPDAAAYLYKRKRSFSVEEVGFFEAAEKLLEIWFDIAPSWTSRGGLRTIPRSKIVALLKIVKCHIISQCKSNSMDAYLLSESSMFVSTNRCIIKTCGTTTLLHAIEPLIELVQTSVPGAAVQDVFYSHKMFRQPTLQQPPHTSPRDETKYLDSIFKDGSAYVLGRLNGERWFLYMKENPNRSLSMVDQTLELLMTDFDPFHIGRFSSGEYPTAKELTKATGIADLIPGSTIDSFVFEPCGYSMNAIIEGDKYFTIHITPQEECSYISFETNVILKSYSSLINKLMDIFQPGKFTVTLFANEDAKCGWSYTAVDQEHVAGYSCKDKQLCAFMSYNLTFAFYEKSSNQQLPSNGDHIITNGSH